jgi:HSP20 family protein
MNELVRWDPFRAVLPFEGSLFGRAWSGPRMDVHETETAYQLVVELPGVKKEAIDVSVYENTVTLTAELTEEKANGEERNWLLRERSYGKFSRNIALPEPVDEDSSQARYADGVLYLTLQKKRATQVKRLTVH